MGLATGCVGMSLQDFERCTPSEFKAVWDAWQDRVLHAERTSWEQARMMCVSMLQPYSKKALRPQDVMAFPWDAEVTSSEETTAAPEKLTREEEMERYRQAIKRAGLK
jgi:hypothetical protein